METTDTLPAADLLAYLKQMAQGGDPKAQAALVKLDLDRRRMNLQEAKLKSQEDRFKAQQEAAAARQKAQEEAAKAGKPAPRPQPTQKEPPAVKPQPSPNAGGGGGGGRGKGKGGGGGGGGRGGGGKKQPPRKTTGKFDQSNSQLWNRSFMEKYKDGSYAKGTPRNPDGSVKDTSEYSTDPATNEWRDKMQDSKERERQQEQERQKKWADKAKENADRVADEKSKQPDTPDAGFKGDPDPYAPLRRSIGRMTHAYGNKYAKMVRARGDLG